MKWDAFRSVLGFVEKHSSARLLFATNRIGHFLLNFLFCSKTGSCSFFFFTVEKKRHVEVGFPFCWKNILPSYFFFQEMKIDALWSVLCFDENHVHTRPLFATDGIRHFCCRFFIFLPEQVWTYFLVRFELFWKLRSSISVTCTG